MHTIAWSVVDDAGESQGLGSRFFEVQNLGGGPSPPLAAGTYVEDRSGSLSAGVRGKTEIDVEELGTVELRLQGKGGTRYVGWGEDMTDGLPVGSTLEEEKGIFHWMIAPGFLGQHVLHFAVGRGNFISPPVEVTITILPKSYYPRERDKGKVEGRRSE